MSRLSVLLGAILVAGCAPRPQSQPADDLEGTAAPDPVAPARAPRQAYNPVSATPEECGQIQTRVDPFPRALAAEWFWQVSARVLWYGLDSFGCVTKSEKYGELADAIPCFWFPLDPRKQLDWDPLPDPQIPFGIEFCRMPMTGKPTAQLKRFRTLAILDLRATAMTDKDLESLTELKGVVHINGIGQVTPEGLNHLKKFPNLRSLYFHGDRLTDAHAKVLSELSGLTDLNLKGSAITDEGAKHLTALKRLKSLDLSETQITTAGLKQLATLPNLNTLAVGAKSGPALGLEPLAQAKELKRLKLVGPGSPLRSVPQLDAVTVLDLSEATPTSEDIEHVLKLSGLTEVKICPSGMTGSGLKPLARLPRLRSLLVRELPSDKDLTPLNDFRQLRTLTISDQSIDFAGLACVAELAELEELSVSSYGVNRGGLAHLAKLKALRKLHLDRASGFGAADFVHLSKLPDLRELTISSPLNGPFQGDFAALRECEQLTHLAVLSARGLDEKALPHFKGMTNLKELRLSQYFSEWFSIAAMKELREALPNCAIGQ